MLDDAMRTARRPWIALAALAGAQLMLVLDVTVVNVALPDITASLHLRAGSAAWVVTAYTVCFGGLMLLGGRIADAVGPRRTALVGLVVFTGASALCGFASGGATLLTGRAIQGIGAALMSPAALATATMLFDDEARRGRALALWSALSGLGSVLGVVAGGVLTSEVGWRWVFAINVPIGAVLLLAIPLLTGRAPAVPPVCRPLDLPGAVLITAGTAAALYGLIDVGAHGWTAFTTVAPLVAAGLLWSAVPAVERRARDPLLRPHLLIRRPTAGGSAAMLVATALMIGGFFLGSFTLQNRDHYSALAVGVAFLPVAVAIVAGAQTAGRALVRFGARVVGVGGLTLASAGYLVASTVRPVMLVVGLSTAAFGIGAMFVTAFTSSLRDAPPTEAGLRSALVNTFHELGGAIGVAVLASVAAPALVSGSANWTSFDRAFLAGAAVAVVGAAIVGALLPGSPHRNRPQKRTALLEHIAATTEGR
jgi:EmrB/QacA subfamily drug resistance transporter